MREIVMTAVRSRKTTLKCFWNVFWIQEIIGPGVKRCGA
jgi:hypothetical protein